MGCLPCYRQSFLSTSRLAHSLARSQGVLCASEFCWATGTVLPPVNADSERSSHDATLSSGCADVLIASDVLYSDEAVQPLTQTIMELLRPGGLLILADPAGEVSGIGSPVRGRAIELCQGLAKAGRSAARPLQLVAAECATVELDGGAIKGDVDVFLVRI
eukprot:COSAG05_NODE_1896_length_3874_cov_3.826225_3_plen_161_part_00